ncbi:radical SAM protein [Bradyrhizobium prioriisuperbiae]|uniref:radical SAM/SPASM domain-containing protein n=1 Tax=Bradyrhizobium prioriisuperbiae TaxID=2854389 RepID=UPI0028E9CA0C|nr:radical SAM protein [Bradyrhizobium prioritasuperba]
MLNHVFIRLLDTCNLECAHCYASCGPKAPDRLPMEAVLGLTRQLGSLQPRHVHLEGGEAFAYRGFWDVLDALNLNNIKPAITSNGLIVDERLIARLVGRVSKLTFSIDGHTAEVHDQIRRRKGSFDRAVNAVQLSVQAKIPTHMISVVWKKSVDHADDLVALAERLVVERLLLFSCGRIGAAVHHWEELSCDFEAWTRYLKRVRVLARTRPWIWFEVDRVRREELGSYIDDDYRPICVRAPRDSVTIDPRGDVYPCGYFIPLKKSLGSILEAPLAEIVRREQDGERYSGACKDPWKVRSDGIVELCKLYSVNYAGLPDASRPAGQTAE